MNITIRSFGDKAKLKPLWGGAETLRDDFVVREMRENLEAVGRKPTPTSPIRYSGTQSGFYGDDFEGKYIGSRPRSDLPMRQTAPSQDDSIGRHFFR